MMCSYPFRTFCSLERLEATFPNSSSRVVGHHPDLLAERIAAVAEGRKVLTQLQPRDVARDPELGDALWMLRSRVKQIELRKVKAKGR